MTAPRGITRSGHASRPASAVRLRLRLAVPLLAGVFALGACTGSGSSGPTSAAPTTGVSSRSTPNPSAAASSRIAHANPFVYTTVTKKQAKKIEKIAARAPGVQSVSYDNEHRTISLYLNKSITGTQRVIADRVVNQVLHPATVPSTGMHKKKHH